MIAADTIKKCSAEVGFDLCGIVRTRPLPRAEERFRDWLRQGRQAGLGYLERHLDKRFDVRKLVADARTIVVCAVSYKNLYSSGYPGDCRTRVASYALAADYHFTIKEMLRQLARRLRDEVPALTGRCFVDSAPLVEKQWAVEAGLGWIGRQSLLVTPEFGTFVLLGELVLTEPCDRYDTPYEGTGCGTCRRCVEHCPTAALPGDRMIDARRCISCRTIEQAASGTGSTANTDTSTNGAGDTADRTADSITGTGTGDSATGTSADIVTGTSPAADLHGWIFGCDCCQSCCPYNLRAPLHRNPAFDPLFDPRDFTAERWRTIPPEEFAALFGRTPLMRCGLEGIRRNLDIIKQSDNE